MLHTSLKKQIYMKDYDPSLELSYLMYRDVNNLYGWAMSQKLPVDCFKQKKKPRFTLNFMQKYDDDNDKGYIFDVDVSYLSVYRGPTNLFLPEKMIYKCQKLVCNIWNT